MGIEYCEHTFTPNLEELTALARYHAETRAAYLDGDPAMGLTRGDAAAAVHARERLELLRAVIGSATVDSVIAEAREGQRFRRRRRLREEQVR
jgi:hypothetical protein